MASDGDEDTFKLYVKGSLIPKNRTLGACTISHRLMMILRLKDLESQVITKNENTQENIKALFPGAKIPFLKHGNFIKDDVFSIEDYLESFGRKFDSDSAEAKAFVSKNKLFMRFSYMVKNVDPAAHPSLENHLNAELQKLEDFLAKQGTTFVGGNDMTLLDCTVLPQILHLRIASKKFFNYEIPEKFEKVIEYVRKGDEMEAFSSTRPADEEIIMFWADKRRG